MPLYFTKADFHRDGFNGHPLHPQHPDGFIHAIHIHTGLPFPASEGLGHHSTHQSRPQQRVTRERPSQSNERAYSGSEADVGLLWWGGEGGSLGRQDILWFNQQHRDKEGTPVGPQLSTSFASGRGSLGLGLCSLTGFSGPHLQGGNHTPHSVSVMGGTGD